MAEVPTSDKENSKGHQVHSDIFGKNAKSVAVSNAEN